MINSRDVSALDPVVIPVCQQHLQLCKAAGIDLIITSTYRDYESQALLYAQGRTDFTNGNVIVTRAKPGESWHNFRCAWDVVPIVGGKPYWQSRDKHTRLLTPIWERVVLLGKQAGAQAAADWKTFKEDAHFQVVPADVKTTADARAKFITNGSLWV